MCQKDTVDTDQWTILNKHGQADVRGKAVNRRHSKQSQGPPAVSKALQRSPSQAQAWGHYIQSKPGTVKSQVSWRLIPGNAPTTKGSQWFPWGKEHKSILFHSGKSFICKLLAFKISDFVYLMSCWPTSIKFYNYTYHSIIIRVLSSKPTQTSFCYLTTVQMWAADIDQSKAPTMASKMQIKWAH